MSWGNVLVAGGTLLSGYMSNKSQSDAVDVAAAAQERSAQAGINEQHDEFAQVRSVLAPFMNAGNDSLFVQKSLLGLNGPSYQAGFLQQIKDSPEFATLTKQGEDAILANASATGGLRGGNTQAALAQFRPSLLSRLIDDHYAKLGGLTSLGENAAAGVGNAGISTGNAITDLLQQGGAAQAGSILAGGKASASNWNNFASTLGTLYGRGAFNFGGGSTTNYGNSTVLSGGENGGDGGAFTTGGGFQ